MNRHALMRRDRGRARIASITRTVGVLAAAGSIALSVAAARAFPGKAGARPAGGHATTAASSGTASRRADPASSRARRHHHARSQTGSTAQQQAAPPASTSSPPVTVSGGS